MKIAFCTGSLACKSVALETREIILIHTTVMSYTWQALCKKSTALAALIITQNTDCPGLFYGSCWRTSSYWEGWRGERIERCEGLETGENGDREFILHALYCY